MLLTLGVPRAFAQNSNPDKPDFDFINVADTSSQGFTAFATFPAINNKGTIVFEASRGLTGGIFKWHKGELTTVASTQDGTITGFGLDPVINKDGRVCFFSTLATGASAIFTDDGNALTKILDSKERGFTRFVGSPSINKEGTCAFDADTSITLPSFTVQASIFSGRSPELTTVLTEQTIGFAPFGNVGINAAGEVVFLGFRQDGSQGVFVVRSKDKDHDRYDENSVDPQQPIDIVDSNNPNFAGASFGDPVINKNGTVADVAFLANGGVEIITGDKRGVTPRTDPASTLFFDSEHPSINDFGDVAFSVTLSAGGGAILAETTRGASPVVVLKTGDPLFGSTVSSLFVGRFALNNHGELVFQYRLNDGRTGVAIANLHMEDED
jgi:hypothetical protein